jgi:Ni,Fe-hydrogenase III large subunit
MHDRRFDYFEVRGEGVFELPVGPIHAGVIEPGHFRFSNIGELILHLDVVLSVGAGLIAVWAGASLPRYL